MLVVGQDFRLGRRAGMDVPDRIAEPLLPLLARIGVEKAEIVVDVAWDHVEIEPLRRGRLLEHEERQALRAGIGQPFIDREAVALRFQIFCPFSSRKGS